MGFISGCLKLDIRYSCIPSAVAVLENEDLRERIPIPQRSKLHRDHDQIKAAMAQIRSSLLRFVQANPRALGRLERELVVRTVTLR